VPDRERGKEAAAVEKALSVRSRRAVALAVGCLVGVMLVAWGVVRATRTYSYGHGYGVFHVPLRCHPLDGIPGATQPDNDCNAHNLGRIAQGAAAVLAGVALLLGMAVWTLVVFAHRARSQARPDGS
jgi:hypothetical protein